jgi:hypothetical protein
MIAQRRASARQLIASIALVLSAAAAAHAQSSQSSANDGWNVGIYPIFAWVPLDIDINVDVPPFDDGTGGGAGEIIDSRFDGAFLGGFYASKGLFRVDADGMWAAVGGDRPERPLMTVDADVIYFHLTGGVKLVKDLYAIGGVRRLALKYDIRIADFPNFQRKPGLWDPVVGVAWHTEGDRRLEVHATFEAGGFGAGAETELGGMFRLDFKPLRHFGITAGYNLLYFRIEDTVRNRTFRVKQTLHGPVVGIGFYF